MQTNLIYYVRYRSLDLLTRLWCTSSLQQIYPLFTFSILEANIDWLSGTPVKFLTYLSSHGPESWPQVLDDG